MVDIPVTDLDDDVILRLEAMAKAKGVTPNDIVLEAIATYVNSDEKEAGHGLKTSTRVDLPEPPRLFQPKS